MNNVIFINFESSEEVFDSDEFEYNEEFETEFQKELEQWEIEDGLR